MSDAEIDQERIDQFQRGGTKIGIDGRDNFVINLDEADPLLIAPYPDGVMFVKGDCTFVVPVNTFNHVVEWLRSWDYI